MRSLRSNLNKVKQVQVIMATNNEAIIIEQSEKIYNIKKENKKIWVIVKIKKMEFYYILFPMEKIKLISNK